MQRYQLFIGIDISKKWIDVCLSTNGKKSQMPHLRIANEQCGFKKMLSFINAYVKEQHLSGPWLFCMEHTGIYVLPLCSFLEEQSLDYVLQSALVIANSLGLRRTKSDPADAASITRYAFLHREELCPSRLPSQRLLVIKHLLSLRQRLIKADRGIKVAANELAAFDSNSLLITQVSDLACDDLSSYIKQVEQSIRDLIRECDTLNTLFELIVSVKGVGLIIAAHLLVYTNGFTAFQTARQFACYIGIAPFQHSSGTSVKKPDRVSHLANKKLKTLISCGAISAMRFDKEIKAYYQRRIEEGKNPFLVQNNVKNKLVQRIFAVVKRGTPYVELNQFSS
jgi:transposase